MHKSISEPCYFSNNAPNLIFVKHSYSPLNTIPLVKKSVEQGNVAF